MNVLVERTGLPAAEIQTAINRIRAETGLEPTLAQVMDPQTIRRLLPVIRGSAEAAEVFSDSVRRLEAELPTALPGAIRAGRPAVSETGEGSALKIAMDEVMSDIRHVPVVSELAPTLFSTPEASRLLARSLEGWRLREAIANADGGPIRMELGQMDNIVRALQDNAGNKTDELSLLAKEIAEALSGELSQQNAAYAGAYHAYTQAKRRVEGIALGRSAGSQTPANLADDVRRPYSVDPRIARNAEEADMAAIRAGGMADGRVDDLAVRAGEGSSPAMRVIGDVQAPNEVARNRTLLGDAEAERLRSMGETAEGAIRRQRSFDVNAPQEQVPGQAARLALSAIPLVGGRASGGFQTNVFAGTIQQLTKLRIPPGAARELAEAMTTGDATTVQAYIDRIARSQRQRQELIELASQVGAAAAATQSVDE
jgi:hypothetical protein